MYFKAIFHDDKQLLEEHDPHTAIRSVWKHYLQEEAQKEEGGAYKILTSYICTLLLCSSAYSKGRHSCHS